MPDVKSLNTVLICEKWEDCVAFYREVLEFPVVDERERFVEFEVMPGARIGILRPLHPGGPMPGHDHVILSLRVEDIEKAYAELQKKCSDLPPVREHPWGASLFELRDPEGWRIEFWSPS